MAQKRGREIRRCRAIFTEVHAWRDRVGPIGAVVFSHLQNVTRSGLPGGNTARMRIALLPAADP
jgi:hypothetical protein